MAYGVGQVQQVPILTMQEADAQAQQQQAQKLTLQAAVEQKRAQLAKARQDAERQQVLQGVFQKNRYEDGTPDFDGIVRDLSSYDPDLAMEWNKKAFEFKKQGRDSKIGELQQSKAEFEAAIPILRALRPDDPSGIQAALPELAKINPQLAQQVATDPASIPQLVNRGLSETAWIKEQEKLVDSYEKDPIGSFLHDMSISRSQEDMDEARAAFRMHAPKSMVERYEQDFGPQWTPQTPQRAIQHALTVKDQIANQQKAADDARMAANAAAQQAIAQGNLDVARGNLKIRQQEANKPAGTDAAGVKLSAGQQQDLEAMLTISDMAKEVRELGDRTKWSGTGALGTGTLSQMASSVFGRGKPENISLRNKVSNMRATIAKLRGGTAFTPNEQKLLDSYTPSIDDGDTVLKQKLIDLESFIELKRKNMLKIAQGDLSPNTAPASKKLTAEELIRKYGGG